MNSFDARSTLTVGDRDVRDLPARRAAVEVRRRAAAVRAQGAAREPAAQRGRADGRRATTSRRSRRWVRDRRAEPRDRLRARARAAAGLHRRAGRRRPGRDARRDARARRRPGAHQPAAAGRARDRPLRAGGRVRHAARLPDQRRPRVRAQPGALRVPALGPAGVRQLRVVPPDTGIVHQVNLEYLARVVFAREARRDGAGLPRHARRHRLPHDDGQRPRRAGLGRRRDRGRGGDAGPAGLDADPAGDRLQARAASCRRARPPPTSS